MSLFGTALGRAAAGAGEAAAGIANKYIDEDLQVKRAQSLADIARASGNQRMADEYAFKNDPTRLAQERATKRDDALAAGKTAEDVALSSNTNVPLLESARQRVAGDANAAHTTATEQTIADAGNKPLMDAAKAIKLNDPVIVSQISTAKAQAAQFYASAAHSNASSGLIGQQTEVAKLAIGDMKRIDKLYDEAMDASKDPNLTPEKRAALIAEKMQQADLLKSKRGGPGLEKESDVTVDKQFTYDSEGNKTGETQTTSKRRPGQQVAKEDPANPYKVVVPPETKAARDKAAGVKAERDAVRSETQSLARRYLAPPPPHFQDDIQAQLDELASGR